MTSPTPPASGEPLSVAALSAPGKATSTSRPAAWLQAHLPGTLLSAVIALAATFVSTLHGGPQLLYALLMGVCFNYLSHESRTRPGIELCSRTLLRLGVGLLGARITAAQIVGLGWTTALTVVAAVATTIALGVWLARRMGMSSSQGVLAGGATAICGASAALAISAVLPRDKEHERFTLLVVVCVTALSTLAMILYPLVARALHLDPQLAGLFIGGTIHDVAQVVGAGYMLGQETGDYATIVKLFRVAMLSLVVIVVSASFRKSAQAGADAHAAGTRKASLVPWFLYLFIAMVVINSLGAVPPQAQDALGQLSRGCLVMAIAALGMKTSFGELAKAGWRPFVLLLVETLWMAGFVLAAIHFA